jgi:predicted aspartyl protease
LPTREIELQSYRIGDVAIPWRRVTVASITTAAVFPTSLDGVLGTDSLSSFDIDLDLPRHRITLYEPGKCGKSGPNWPGQHARIDAGRSPGDHLFFPVLLDNRRITAMIDTGAQRTTLSTTVALALGVTEAALARDRAIKTRGAANEELHSRLHQFARLEIAPLVIRNPEIVVTDLRLRDADIVLGMDLLGTRRLWLSYKSFRILLSDR